MYAFAPSVAAHKSIPSNLAMSPIGIRNPRFRLPSRMKQAGRPNPISWAYQASAPVAHSIEESAATDIPIPIVLPAALPRGSPASTSRPWPWRAQARRVRRSRCYPDAAGRLSTQATAHALSTRTSGEPVMTSCPPIDRPRMTNRKNAPCADALPKRRCLSRIVGAVPSALTCSTLDAVRFSCVRTCVPRLAASVLACVLSVALQGLRRTPRAGIPEHRCLSVSASNTASSFPCSTIGRPIHGRRSVVSRTSDRQVRLPTKFECILDSAHAHASPGLLIDTRGWSGPRALRGRLQGTDQSDRLRAGAFGSLPSEHGRGEYMRCGRAETAGARALRCSESDS
ncbi:hypothetical protein OH77DRAFT_1095537 [Trametes cingulata]|nr:hypothetical protein OH77DRAFT_1095537 [Trametes cingulata]